MSLLLHPDRHATDAAATMATVFPIVSAASTRLSAPAQRAAFDLLGATADHDDDKVCPIAAKPFQSTFILIRSIVFIGSIAL